MPLQILFLRGIEGEHAILSKHSETPIFKFKQ